MRRICWGIEDLGFLVLVCCSTSCALRQQEETGKYRSVLTRRLVWAALCRDEARSASIAFRSLPCLTCLDGFSFRKDLRLVVLVHANSQCKCRTPLHCALKDIGLNGNLDNQSLKEMQQPRSYRCGRPPTACHRVVQRRCAASREEGIILCFMTWPHRPAL